MRRHSDSDACNSVPEISPLAKKLLIKPGMSMCLLEAPEDYESSLAPLPDGAAIDHDTSTQHDFVQLFAVNSAILASQAPRALAALKTGGVFWIAFPKGSSKGQTDLTRDKGWDSLHSLGWQLVSLVSIDDTWSGARIRPITAK